MNLQLIQETFVDKKFSEISICPMRPWFGEDNLILRKRDLSIHASLCRLHQCFLNNEPVVKAKGAA
jgi:hypothetical protein